MEKEIEKLVKLCVVAGIEDRIKIEPVFDGHKVSFFRKNGSFLADCICHCGSYGGPEGFLELYGLLTPEEEEIDEVLGWLTANQVFSRFLNYWLSEQEKEKD